MKTNIIKFQNFFFKYEKCKIQVTMLEKKLPRTNLFLIITFQRSLQNTHKTSVK